MVQYVYNKDNNLAAQHRAQVAHFCDAVVDVVAQPPHLVQVSVAGVAEYVGAVVAVDGAYLVLALHAVLDLHLVVVVVSGSSRRSGSSGSSGSNGSSGSSDSSGSSGSGSSGNSSGNSSDMCSGSRMVVLVLMVVAV